MPKKKSKRRRAQAAGTGIGNDIKEAMKSGKLLIGSNCVLKDLKKGGLEALIFASNLPEASRKGIDSQATVSGIEVREFGADSAKLGEACGKPFNVLLIGIKK
jgi:ribosomal protein L30E